MKKLIIGAVFVLACLINASAQAVAPKPCFDFYGSGRTSFVTANENGNNIVWRLRNNGGTGEETVFWGLSGSDILSPGYFDLDNIADVAVWRDGAPANYFIRRTAPSAPPSGLLTIQWGTTGDFPTREADYDGDGRDDPTVVRRVNNRWNWYFLRSSNNTLGAVVFGIGDGSLLEDVPLAGADYTGDGRAEIGVIRPNLFGGDTYLIGDSNTGAVVMGRLWGELFTDVFMTGDYLGDNRADFAVWRGITSFLGTGNGFWYIQENGGNNRVFVQFGIPSSQEQINDIPVCGDYNGDGKSDIAVYRYTNNTFYWLNSPSLSNVGGQQFGQPGDLPVAALKGTAIISAFSNLR
ncbi:MAG: VCBS repeat-containing protein [Acidobacteriota bacterium]|nr:VCBS repeat-containing protein [Acidobacteriota bacterium]